MRPGTRCRPQRSRSSRVHRPATWTRTPRPTPPERAPRRCRSRRGRHFLHRTDASSRRGLSICRSPCQTAPPKWPWRRRPWRRRDRARGRSRPRSLRDEWPRWRRPQPLPARCTGAESRRFFPAHRPWRRLLPCAGSTASDGRARAEAPARPAPELLSRLAPSVSCVARFYSNLGARTTSVGMTDAPRSRMAGAPSDGKSMVAQVTASRRAVLRALAACERGLVRAYASAQAKVRRADPYAALIARGLALHRAHMRWLGEALRALGGEPPESADDLWLQGRPSHPRTLAVAECMSHDTLHDALASFEHTFAESFERHVVEDHRFLMQAWQPLRGTEREPSVIVERFAAPCGAPARNRRWSESRAAKARPTWQAGAAPVNRSRARR